jgi:hypothetical protein
MSSITNLPDELLVDVLSYFEHDLNALIALARVSHPFHRIARSYIFRHVHLPQTESGDGLSGGTTSDVTERLLQRSFDENLALCGLVWSYGPIRLLRPQVDFNGPYYTAYESDEESDEPNYCVTERSMQMLASLTGLQKLWITCAESYDNATDFVYPLFESRHTRKLSSVKLENPGEQEMVSYMLLPNIRTFTVEDPSSGPLLWRYVPSQITNSRAVILESLEPSAVKASRLQSLELFAPKMTMPLKTLGKILSFCPQLSNLRIRSRLGVAFLGFPPPEFTFKTVGIIDALNHVRDTLKHLELTIPAENILTFLPSYIAEDHVLPLNLSQFRVLESLKISGLCLYRTWVREDQKDIHRLIPSSLRSLSVSERSITRY